MEAGKEVVWTSQSGGSWTEKNGKVVAEIPAGKSAKAHVPKTAKKSHIKFDDVSQKDRVLVEVMAGKTGNIKYYYCPLKSVLEAQRN